MRWIVGDVQGCAREFERLLEEIRFDPAGDEASRREAVVRWEAWLLER